ncbi:MAG: glycosyltransferase [Clostridium sp.]|nr:glycosyltransferase [Clostridium sp.]
MTGNDTPVGATPPLKVTFVCHSDMLGGASVVTYRLAEALRREGIDARLVVYTKISDSENVSLIGTRFVRGLRFAAERARIFLANGFDRGNLFKVSIANTGMPVASHPWVAEADVVALSWINQGLMSLRGVGRLLRTGKPLVWIMHDMWNLTGICHHAYECEAWREECGHCQFLTGRSAGDLSHKVWRRKKELYDSGKITFIAVSNWLAAKARQSSLLAGRDVRVIPNAFPIDNFLTEPTHQVRTFNIRYDRDTILMGAARLDDPIKGFDYALEALNILFDTNPKLASRSQAIFFGAIRDRSRLDNLRFPHVHLGRVNDWRLLRQLYASAKVVLSTSLYETLPGTLIEGQAAGCLPVSFGRGGQSDIITHLKDGYIAEYKNPASVAEGIEWALSQNPDRGALHESVRERFSSKQVALRYVDLFNELTGRRKD